MELTPEQNAIALKKLFNKEPWEGRVSYNEQSGQVELHDLDPGTTESHGAVSTGLRQLVQSVPETAMSLAGGALMGALTRGPTTALKALGPLGLAGGVTADLLAQGVGAGLGSAAYQKFGPTKLMRDIAYMDSPNPELQQMRDIAEHPTAAKLGGYASMIPLARFQKPQELVGGLRKLGSRAAMIPAELAAVKTAASNAAVGAGMEGYRQIKARDFDPAALIEATVAGLPFGASRLSPKPVPKAIAAPETSTATTTAEDLSVSPTRFSSQGLRFNEAGRLEPLGEVAPLETTAGRELPGFARHQVDPVEVARQKALEAGLDVEFLEQYAQSHKNRPFEETFPEAVAEALSTKGKPESFNEAAVPPVVEAPAPIEAARPAAKPPTSPQDASPLPEAVPVPRDQPPTPTAPVAERVAERVQEAPAEVPPVIRPQAPEPTANEPLVPAEDRLHVPLSIVNSVAKISKPTGAALADMFADKTAITGRYSGTLLDYLAQFPKELVNSTLEKRLRSHMLGVTPDYTPTEKAIVDAYAKTMSDSAKEATATGYPIDVQTHWVPEMPSPARMQEYQHNGQAFLDKYLPAFHKLNALIYGKSYNPAEGADYFTRYLAAASKAPNSLGSEFAALVKSARKYHLPEEVRDMDHFSVINRYFNRYANQIAKARHIDTNPEALSVLGYEKIDPATGQPIVDPRASSPEAQNAKLAVENVLMNEGKGKNRYAQEANQLATGVQQAAYSGAMQTMTGFLNTIQKYKDHLMHAATISGGLRDVALGSLQPAIDWANLKVEAIKSGITKPGVDPTTVEDASPTIETANILKHGALTMRKYTLGEFFETLNRVQDYTIGSRMARTQLELAKAGDKDAINFLRKFGAGAMKNMTPEQQAMMVGKNYAEGIQSSYGPQGLAAPLLTSGLTSKIFRIQRFGIENMARAYRDAIIPASNGDLRPLIGYLLGAGLTYPMIEKVKEWFSGKKEPNVPTEQEILAGKKPEMLEKLLNVMAAAREVGLFGAAGNAVGTVAANVRGQQQGLVGDPSLSLSVDLMQNLAAASQAWREGESSIEAMLEAVRRTLTDNMQLLRRFGRDPAEADDARNKRVFEYLNERRKVPIGKMAWGLTLGGLGSANAREISPTTEAAKEGDQEALMKLSRSDRKRLRTYPGSFADQRVEGQYQTWLETTKGPEAVEAYRGRKVKYKEKIAGTAK